jgi:hypothetical protein
MADKYQTMQPGEYFDWEQPEVDQHLAQFEEYKKNPGGHFMDEITLTEQMIVDHNKRWNMLDPLYTDTEYARAHGHPGCPALPCLVGMGGHGAAPCANFPHDMGDRFYYTAIGGDIRYDKPLYAGDKVKNYAGVEGELRDGTIPGDRVRKWFMTSHSVGKDDDGNRVCDGKYYMVDAYSKIIDGSTPPSQSEQLSEWTTYCPPAHYTTDEDYARIRELWSQEVLRGEKTLYWEDVEVGTTLPGTCSDGPLTYMHMVAMNPAPIEFMFTREELSDPKYTAELYRDQYGQYLDQTALHYGGRNIPGSRAMFYNHNAALLLTRVVTNFIGNDGYLSRLQWELFPFSRELQTETVGAATLNKVPYMKGRFSNRHGGEGDTVIGHGYVTGKRVDDAGRHVVEFAVWGETLDGDIIQVCEIEAVLPSKEA